MATTKKRSNLRAQRPPKLRPSSEPNGACSRHSLLVERILSERMEKDAVFARRARRTFV